MADRRMEEVMNFMLRIESAWTRKIGRESRD